MAARPDAPAGGTGFLDAMVFIAFVAIGAFYILIAKSAGIPAGWVTFVPVAIMVAYAVTVRLARGLLLRDDQTGDNLYYMGFLFTLTSLGVSLAQFTVSGAAEEIVRNFGVAIATTIAGIALRLFMNQMRRDPAEIERVTRLELADAARRVRRELDSAVIEMNHFRRSVRQSAEEGVADLRQLGEQAAALAAALDGVTRRIADGEARAALKAPLAGSRPDPVMGVPGAGSSGAGVPVAGVTSAMRADGFDRVVDRMGQMLVDHAAAMDRLTAALSATGTGDDRPTDRGRTPVAFADPTPVAEWSVPVVVAEADRAAADPGEAARDAVAAAVEAPEPAADDPREPAAFPATDVERESAR
ncbi:hypothetical protein [Mongoliimonas terrestris]|uniref:hypothetical protein n=1 Tax=Mongoliimonas terrestris TaxID=1709001 RepID=UPI0009495F5B|nr:hypothetical protein [Mongoliimonas terrestris]